MPASVCQHESGRFIGPVKDKPRRYWHYRIGQFPVFQRQSAAFSAVLTLEVSKSHQIAEPLPFAVADLLADLAWLVS